MKGVYSQAAVPLLQSVGTPQGLSARAWDRLGCGARVRRVSWCLLVSPDVPGCLPVSPGTRVLRELIGRRAAGKSAACSVIDAILRRPSRGT